MAHKVRCTTGDFAHGGGYAANERQLAKCVRDTANCIADPVKEAH
jgi:hypothetical protein